MVDIDSLRDTSINSLKFDPVAVKRHHRLLYLTHHLEIEWTVTVSHQDLKVLLYCFLLDCIKSHEEVSSGIWA
jgi:hypothetical protein